MSNLNTELESAISIATKRGNERLVSKNLKDTFAHAQKVNRGELEELSKHREAVSKLTEFVSGPHFAALAR